MSEDLSHDAHLRAALRHAPDHALAPPAGVNLAILSAARQAHRPPRATVAPPPPVQMVPAHAPRWLSWLQRLATPRWASALATAFVAALGLGLWFDLGQEPVVERPAAVLAPPPSPEPAGSATTARDATKDAAPTAQPKAESTSQPAPAQRNDRAAPERAQSASPTDRMDARKAARGEAAVRRPREANAAAIGERAPTTPPARKAEEGSSVRDSVGDERSGAAPQSAAPPEQAPAALAKTAPAPNAGAEPVIAASPALTLLRRVRAERAAAAARWTWQAPQAGTITAFDEMGDGWLLRVVQAARGRWSDVTDAGAAHDALEVRWWRDGWPHATLRIEAEGLRWIEANGRVRYAPMDAAAMQRLRAM